MGRRARSRRRTDRAELIGAPGRPRWCPVDCSGPVMLKHSKRQFPSARLKPCFRDRVFFLYLRITLLSCFQIQVKCLFSCTLISFLNFGLDSLELFPAKGLSLVDHNFVKLHLSMQYSQTILSFPIDFNITWLVRYCVKEVSTPTATTLRLFPRPRYEIGRACPRTGLARSDERPSAFP